MQYKTLSSYLKQTFGTKVYKLSLSTGCTCPNRDGTLSHNGCTFCSSGGSGEFAEKPLPVDQQIELAKKRVDAKFPKGMDSAQRKYIAYFQSFTNTYAPAAKLEPLFTKAISRPEIVALSIGTRPDCLPPDILSMLSRLNRIKPVWVELGLQTIHEQTALAVNRGYSLSTFEQAYKSLKSLGLTVIVHVILYLPGESRSGMLETVRYLSALNPVLDGIKLHLLQVLQGTELGKLYRRKPFYLPTLEEYCALVADCLELLPPETVVHRITGDGPKSLLMAPEWCADKKTVLNTLTNYLKSR